jgi:hypothetical protein
LVARLPPKNRLRGKPRQKLNGTGFLEVLTDLSGSQIVSGGLSKLPLPGNRVIFSTVRAQSFDVLEIFRKGRAPSSNIQENFCIAPAPSSNDREIF